MKKILDRIILGFYTKIFIFWNDSWSLCILLRFFKKKRQSHVKNNDKILLLLKKTIIGETNFKKQYFIFLPDSLIRETVFRVLS